MEEMEDKLRLSADRLKVLEAEISSMKAKEALNDVRVKARDGGIFD